MEDLIQLLIFAIILVLGLLSGSKRKKKGGTPSPRRPRRPVPTRETIPPAERPTPRRSAPTASTPRQAPAPPARRTSLEETLLEVLGQQLPQPKPPPEPEAETLEVIPEQEARSLEQLEISEEARHARFHERYLETPTPPVPVPARRPRLRLDRRSLREAIIWQTVLGPPEGLDG